MRLAPWVWLATIACSNAETWAVDTILLTPEDGDLRTGEQLWEVYPPRWGRTRDDTPAICDARYLLDLSPLAPCSTCAVTWHVEPTLVGTQCRRTATSTTFEAIRALGVEPSGLAWVDVGAGWQLQGLTVPPNEWPSTGSVRIESAFAWRLPDE